MLHPTSLQRSLCYTRCYTVGAGLSKRMVEQQLIMQAKQTWIVSCLHSSLTLSSQSDGVQPASQSSSQPEPKKSQLASQLALHSSSSQPSLLAIGRSRLESVRILSLHHVRLDETAGVRRKICGLLSLLRASLLQSYQISQPPVHSSQPHVLT